MDIINAIEGLLGILILIGIWLAVRNSNKELQIIMATIQELQTSAQTLAADVKTLKTGVEAFIAKNPDTSGDLQKVLDSLTATDADVKATDAQIEPPVV